VSDRSKSESSQILCVRSQRLDNSRANNIRIGVAVSTESFQYDFERMITFIIVQKYSGICTLSRTGGGRES